MKYILVVWILSESGASIPTVPTVLATYTYQTSCVAAAQDWSKQKDKAATYRAACVGIE